MDNFKLIIFCLLVFTNILIVLEICFKTNTFSSCNEVLLNMSNPFSYINKVTKPFLIELVNNATKNCKRNLY